MSRRFYHYLTALVCLTSLLSCEKKVKQYELNIFLAEPLPSQKLPRPIIDVCKTIVLEDTVVYNPHIVDKSPTLLTISIPHQKQDLYSGADDFLSNMFGASNNEMTINTSVEEKLSKTVLPKEFLKANKIQITSKKTVDSLIESLSKDNQQVIILGKNSQIAVYNKALITYHADSLQTIISNILLNKNDLQTINLVYGLDISKLNLKTVNKTPDSTTVRPPSSPPPYGEIVKAEYLCDTKNFIKYQKVHDGYNGFVRGKILARNSRECGYKPLEGEDRWVSYLKFPEKCEKNILYRYERNTRTGLSRRIKIGTCENTLEKTHIVSDLETEKGNEFIIKKTDINTKKNQ